ncbi:glycosyl transferase family 1 [Prolixibacteraceae bacterium JC049]|nr:glycosyl transferase family 1 [Prolixibacteraceae bacterium JC049]
MKKVLIITYYWPPSGGAGVQRWLKFAKYLPENGWQPIIYTPSNPENPIEDHSLVKEVPDEAIILKQPIWEPYEWYKRFVGKKGEKINTGFLSEKKEPGMMEKLSVWVRGNFFIPDARKFWIKPSVKYLAQYLKENPVDAIVSTGPPHSMHMIAMKVGRKVNIPWLADFRDPWTNIDYYSDLKLSRWADNKHHALEKAVVQNCNELVVVGKQMKEEFEELRNSSIEVITNGYDESDFSEDNIVLDEKFSIVHIGTIAPNRNPKVLWSALGELVKDNDELKNDLEIRLIGKVDQSVFKSIDEAGLTNCLNRVGYVSHSEVFGELRKSQILLLAINDTPNAKGILTGKFFEYLAAKRPVLAVGPEDGEVARILKETGAGEVAGFSDLNQMKSSVLSLYDRYKKRNLAVTSKGTESYSRRILTKDLVTILNRTTVTREHKTNE